jgi:hypothetical protein
MICLVDGCNKLKSSKGLCNIHYGRFIRHGDYQTLRKRAIDKKIILKDSYSLLELTKNKFSKIDNEDISKVKLISWSFSNGYAVNSK